VAFGNGTFVAVGGRYSGFDPLTTILTSTDATHWVYHQAPSTDYLQAVTHSGKEFIAVGRRGDILISPDGMNWENRAPAAPLPLSGVAYGNGRFVAVGGPDASGDILSSVDGIHWDQHLSGLPNHLYGITFSQGAFVATGARGELRVSEDGVDWTVLRLETPGFLTRALFGQETFLSVGQAGTILESGSLSEPYLAGMMNDDGFRLIFGSGNLPSVNLQTSSDLKLWQDLLPSSRSGARISHTDTNLSQNHRFYRLQSP
jgi:hypothetical protein